MNSKGYSLNPKGASLNSKGIPSNSKGNLLNFKVCTSIEFQSKNVLEFNGYSTHNYSGIPVP